MSIDTKIDHSVLYTWLVWLTLTGLTSHNSPPYTSPQQAKQTMRAHAAFWVYALEVGTPTTKEHVRMRKPDDDESKWLTWQDATRIRKMWLALPPEERLQRLTATPDPTFPEAAVTGLLDDRTKASPRLKQKRKKKRLLDLHAHQKILQLVHQVCPLLPPYASTHQQASRNWIRLAWSI